MTGHYRGLYNLGAPGDAPPIHPQRPRLTLDRFWQAFFAHNLDLWGKTPLLAARDGLQRSLPRLGKPLQTNLLRLQADLAQGLKQRPIPLEQNFWQNYPPLLRPLTGYIHMLLQNDNYSPKAYAEALKLVENLHEITDA